MGPISKGFAAAALVALTAQPCLAADDLRDLGSPERRTAAFAGASFRMALDGRSRQAPTARLQLGVTHTYQDRRSASPAVTYRVAGLELGASRRGAPELSVAGRPVREMERRLGVSTGGAIAIGALAVAGVIALVFAASDAPEIDWGED